MNQMNLLEGRVVAVMPYSTPLTTIGLHWICPESPVWYSQARAS